MAAPKEFSYGGQAVIEGVMMRGAHKVAVAVRNPKGEIVIHEQPLNAALYRGRISKTPFVRGVVGLWDALGLGTRALMWSADVALGEDGSKTRAKKKSRGFSTARSATGRWRSRCCSASACSSWCRRRRRAVWSGCSVWSQQSFTRQPARRRGAAAAARRLHLG